MYKNGIYGVRLIIFFLMTFVVTAQANILYQPDNLDFEQGEPGIVPNSWVFPSRLATAGYIAFVDNKIFYEGRQSVAIDNPFYNADTALVESNQNMAALYQSVDAFPYRNKYVKFGAWVKFKIEEIDAHGKLWIVARNEQRQTIISLYGDDDKIIDTNWHYKQIIILVPPDTDELRFGFLIEGKGRLWADDATFEILSPADGAAIELDKLGLKANKVIGDLDSFIGSNIESKYSQDEIIFVEDQETNDFEKCLKWCMDNSLGNILIIGFHGGLLEHTINNWSILMRYGKGLNLCVYEKGRYAIPIYDDIEMDTSKDEIISIIPNGELRLSTKSLRWELKNESLNFGEREGARNQVLGNQFSIKVHSGEYLLFVNAHLPFRPFFS